MGIIKKIALVVVSLAGLSACAAAPHWEQLLGEPVVSIKTAYPDCDVPRSVIMGESGRQVIF